MKIRKIRFAEVQRGKLVADAIFALRLRHPHKCVAETTGDILTPKDLVQALRYESETVDSLPEPMEIDTNRDVTEAEGGEKQGWFSSQAGEAYDILI